MQNDIKLQLDKILHLINHVTFVAQMCFYVSIAAHTWVVLSLVFFRLDWEWFALSPYGKKVEHWNPGTGTFLCGVCHFSLCLCGLSLGTSSSPHSPNKQKLLGKLELQSVLSCVWVQIGEQLFFYGGAVNCPLAQGAHCLHRMTCTQQTSATVGAGGSACIEDGWMSWMSVWILISFNVFSTANETTIHSEAEFCLDEHLLHTASGWDQPCTTSPNSSQASPLKEDRRSLPSHLPGTFCTQL